MTDHFTIEDVGLVFGDCSTMSAFLQKWLCSAPFGSEAEEVLLPHNLVARGSRVALLELSACAGLEAGLPIMTWQEFRAEPFAQGDRLVVVDGLSRSGDEPLDLAIALQVSRHAETGVQVERDESRAWVAPVPRVPEEVETLMAIAVSAACCRHAVRPGRHLPTPWFGPRVAQIGQWRLRCDDEPLALRFRRPRLHVFSGADRDQVTENLSHGNESNKGPARLVVVATDEELRRRLDEAEAMLRTGRTFARGIYFFDSPLDGKVAWVFPGLYSSYQGIGNDWLLAVPEWRKSAPEPDDDEVMSRVRETLWWQRRAVDLLRSIRIDADQILGVSAGELFGMWATTGEEKGAAVLEESNLFRRELAGDFAAPREYWANAGFVEAATTEANLWQTWAVIGPIDRVREVVDETDLVFITEIRTDHECVIAGYPAALDDTLAELLDSPKIQVEELEFRAALHCPAAAPATDVAESVFGRIPSMTGMGFMDHLEKTLDIRPIWMRAWNEEIRLFIETGPRGSVSNWIDRALGDAHVHLATSLDRRLGWGPREIYDVIGQLVACGQDVDASAIDELLTFDELPMSLHRLPSKTTLEPDRLVESVDVARKYRALQGQLTDAHLSFIDNQTAALRDQMKAQLDGLADLIETLDP